MADTVNLRFTCNGLEQQLDLLPSTSLAQLLRDHLKLTGTKIGCEEGECGACTVLIDGMAVNSCIYPAVKVQGRKVTTIEGLEQDGHLHPLQQAFIDHGAVQCGFCTTGLLMSAYALLQQNPSPSEADIRRAISGNLCRCTGYLQIISAIQDAARALRQ